MHDVQQCSSLKKLQRTETGQAVVLELGELLLKDMTAQEETPLQQYTLSLAGELDTLLQLLVMAYNGVVGEGKQNIPCVNFVRTLTTQWYAE